MRDIHKSKWSLHGMLFIFLVMLLQLSCGTATDQGLKGIGTQGDSSSGGAEPDATISIDAAQTLAQYNPLISGSNLNWIYNADGIYDPVTEQINAYAELKIKEMGIKMLRFPGGSLSEYYEWKSGIGPAATRGYGLDYGMNQQKMNFGIDEFLRFCERSGILPVYTVGYSNNTPESAAEIVEYCNGSVLTTMGALRARNGHPAPYGVKYWEIGNEVYVQGTTAEAATAYGAKTAAMAVMMKKVDPLISIGAIGIGSIPIWDNSVLRECAHSIDFIVYHGYFPYTPPGYDDQTNNAVIASTQKIMHQIRTLQEVAAKYNPDLAIAVTEYNLYFCDAQGMFVNKQQDMQQALFIAECMRLFQLNNVMFANKWDLASSRHYFADINLNGGTAPSLAPSYYAQQMFLNAGMNVLLKAETISPTVNVLNVGAIANESNAPVLTAIAGKDTTGTILSVIVINRDLTNSLKTRIDISNAGTINQINLTTLRIPTSGSEESFVIERSEMAPNALGNIVIPAGSISLFKVSVQSEI